MNNEFMARVIARFGLSELAQTEGICKAEDHGHEFLQTVIMHDGIPHCSHCYGEMLKRQAHTQWLKTRRLDLLAAAHLPRRYIGQKFTASTPEQRLARATAKQFLDEVEKKSGWCTLIMQGGVGTGKTLMATELAGSIIDKFDQSVRYCTAKQMISEIQSAYSTEGKSEEGEILRFVQYGVLIIDEIDIKSDSKNSGLLLQEVINRRYNDCKPLVVITNQSFDNLSKHVGDRIDSRLHENAFVAAFTWEDFRSK